jgi:hypothetical protein
MTRENKWLTQVEARRSRPQERGDPGARLLDQFSIDAQVTRR